MGRSTSNYYSICGLPVRRVSGGNDELCTSYGSWLQSWQVLCSCCPVAHRTSMHLIVLAIGFRCMHELVMLLWSCQLSSTSHPPPFQNLSNLDLGTSGPMNEVCDYGSFYSSLPAPILLKLRSQSPPCIFRPAASEIRVPSFLFFSIYRCRLSPVSLLDLEFNCLIYTGLT